LTPPAAPLPSTKKLAKGKDASKLTKLEIDSLKKNYSDKYDAPVFSKDEGTKPDFFNFEVVYQSKKSLARVGRIITPHGVINTPNFVPVATNASLKGVDSVTATGMNTELMFVNTFHMLVQPGVDIVAGAGGLHQFMNRTKPIITDSGGFQVFSLQHGSVFDEINMKSRKRKVPEVKTIRTTKKNEDGTSTTSLVEIPSKEAKSLVVKINEEGVVFRSYRSGVEILLTPETSVMAQKKLGADIIIPFDELLPFHVTPEKLLESLHRTHRWQARSLRHHLQHRQKQAMYCVIHGGMDFDLRKTSIDYLTSQPFDGIAVGGSLGKDRDDLLRLLANIMPQIAPQHKPVHLLGIADPLSIRGGVPFGIDTFDSCYPTRLGRHGTMLLAGGMQMKITASDNQRKYHKGIVEGCECYTCSNYSLAYLHHLFKAHEPVGEHLGAIHNIHQMVVDMKQYREAILNGNI
jgi:queuine tRNA-ribosyltransferase